MVLERTLESPLDCKEIQPVHPKGNQFWIFIGRTSAEALILWPSDVKNWLTGKDPDAGKDRRQEKKGTTEDEISEWHHQLDGHEFEQAPGDGEGQRILVAAVHGAAGVGRDWETEQQQCKENHQTFSPYPDPHTSERLISPSSQMCCECLQNPLHFPSFKGKWLPNGSPPMSLFLRAVYHVITWYYPILYAEKELWKGKGFR